MAEKKPKPQTRAPGTPRGLVLPERVERKPEENPMRDTIRAAQLPPTTHHPTTYQPPPTNHPVAPERDFVRVPNSVVRDALPAGLFKGESKKTYDALYQRTRGAVVPRRMLRATLADVMAWARVSHNTLKAHLKHLARVGLVKVHYVRGDNTGAEYEVFTPEEAPPTTHQPETTYQPPTSQNVAPPTSQNLVLGGGGQSADFQRTSEDSKTSLKTNTERTTDDEAAPHPSTPMSTTSTGEFAAFTGLFEHLLKTSTEITGKSPSTVDREKWREVGEVLSTELRIAAGRTTVSSVPAFLAEHLRRRLFKDKTQLVRLAENVPQAESAQGIDVSQCPDCHGKGHYFLDDTKPETFRLCRHEKLTSKTD